MGWGCRGGIVGFTYYVYYSSPAMHIIDHGGGIMAGVSYTSFFLYYHMQDITLINYETK